MPTLPRSSPRQARRRLRIKRVVTFPIRSVTLALLVLAACKGSSPASEQAAPAGVTASEPSETVRYRLYKFLNPIGEEIDTFMAMAGGGVEAKAAFTFTDRGTSVPLAAVYRLGADGLPVEYQAWGNLSRFAAVDDHVRAQDKDFAVRRLGAPPRTASVARPYAFSSGYAPMLGQEILLRTWAAQGRPARLPLLPEGNARIVSRGKETYQLDGADVAFEHLAVEGLVWGREDVWLDDKGRLAAVVVRDAEFDHFEGVRAPYATLIEALVARAGADAVAALGAAAAAAEETGPVALVGGRLIDGTGAAPVEDAVVVYRGDQIVAAGPRATTPVPADARTVDVAGKTLIPGLWDMHAHVEQVEQLAAYLAAGVTTVRDLGNIMSFITSMRDAIEAGRGVGPRILVAGLVDSSGPRALGTLRVDSEADIAPMIERLVAAGCIEVKIYSSLEPALVKPLAAEAHRRGLRVTGHIPGGMTVVEAVAAGYDGINHLSAITSLALPTSSAERQSLSGVERRRRLLALDLAAPANSAFIDQLVAKKIVVDPTMALGELMSYPLATLTQREPGLAKMPRELTTVWQGVDPAGAADAAAMFTKNLAVLAELHRRGVIIVAGTDQSVIGHSLHREIELYVQAGFTPMQALQSATSVPARAVGRDDLGSIAAGKRADLLVLDANPLDDIRNTRAIALVVARGRTHRPATLWPLSGFAP
jgi:imidazolonepropionase-like amidohydrolase